jgi:hypothetical protein
VHVNGRLVLSFTVGCHATGNWSRKNKPQKIKKLRPCSCNRSKFVSAYRSFFFFLSEVWNEYICDWPKWIDGCCIICGIDPSAKSSDKLFNDFGINRPCRCVRCDPAVDTFRTNWNGTATFLFLFFTQTLRPTWNWIWSNPIKFDLCQGCFPGAILEIKRYLLYYRDSLAICGAF